MHMCNKARHSHAPCPWTDVAFGARQIVGLLVLNAKSPPDTRVLSEGNYGALWLVKT
ncbi:hypothetical protein GCM10011499_32790 [Pelagibacterium lentulum]|uniref:Uncharacterized protein n=1 Tax=Pelagibacterium lentulum TaxID=2029865 RepID=A0A916RMU8_9HYPH|nr:hypothetical protein GCM10011499_32790 [Pelagibacterium lentulum]